MSTRVLVIEEADERRELIAAALSRAGYVCVSAITPDDSIVIAGVFDVILLEARCDSSADFARSARKTGLRPPGIVAITASLRIDWADASLPPRFGARDLVAAVTFALATRWVPSLHAVLHHTHRANVIAGFGDALEAAVRCRRHPPDHRATAAPPRQRSGHNPRDDRVRRARGTRIG